MSGDGLKSWKPGLVATFHADKERLVGPVNAAQHVLRAITAGRSARSARFHAGAFEEAQNVAPVVLSANYVQQPLVALSA